MWRNLPLAREINRAVIETYEYIETLPDKKAREKHLKLVEKGLKEQYTPIMKKLTFSQGKLLIKLVNRQTDSSSYELVKAFMGPFKAGFYQTFAALFWCQPEERISSGGRGSTDRTGGIVSWKRTNLTDSYCLNLLLLSEFH